MRTAVVFLYQLFALYIYLYISVSAGAVEAYSQSLKVKGDNDTLFSIPEFTAERKICSAYNFKAECKLSVITGYLESFFAA